MKKEKRIPENHEMLPETAKHMKIKDLPEYERPYEKCELFGPSALSDAELLAVVIRCGTEDARATDLACRILKLHEGYRGINCLFHLSMQDLTGIKGIGRIKAIQLMCAAEMARRIRAEEECRKKFKDSDDAIAYFNERLRYLEHEEVHAAYLDQKMRLIFSECVYKGTLDRCMLEPREIFLSALKANAAFIIVAHNHPSGNSTPSDADLSATRRMTECGNFMGIKLYDHIIVGYEGCVSMKDEGMM